MFVEDGQRPAAPAVEDRNTAQPALVGAGLAPERQVVLTIAPRGADPQLGRILRAAAPADRLIVRACAADAAQAVSAMQAHRRSTHVFVLDFRGCATSDLTSAVKRVGSDHPGAELIVLFDADDPSAIVSVIQVASTPERITFIPSPFAELQAVRAVCAVVRRAQSAMNVSDALQTSRSAESDVRAQLDELTARFQIAVHASRHDGLTGALNRSGFVEMLSARLERRRQDQVVIMFDLDRFKAVNDTLGHGAGDDLVRKIATGVRTVLPTGAVMARLGGDEFAIALEAPTSTGVEQVAQSVLAVCHQPRQILGHEVQVSASVGVAAPGNGSVAELMRQADLALYAAKREGRNRVRRFDADLDSATKQRLSIEHGLERALRGGQLRMVYQPIVDASSTRVSGFEALIRWESPELGIIPPSEFIPVAEETGLILDVGDWITRQALRDCKKWGSPYVSINLSSRQFLRHNVGERILRYAREADVRPEKIQIELTETALIDDVDRAAYNLQKMRDAGVRVALDDFGTGYSSLTYLRRFAIDCIKIDKSFVDGIARDRQSAIIVASISRLATSLGMSVVAEGVETEDQRRLLIAAGCGALQGYHFGRPVGIQEVLDHRPVPQPAAEGSK